jgi:hypothetical protein
MTLEQALTKAELMRQLMYHCSTPEECLFHMDILLRDMTRAVEETAKANGPVATKEPNIKFIDLTAKRQKEIFDSIETPDTPPRTFRRSAVRLNLKEILK